MPLVAKKRFKFFVTIFAVACFGLCNLAQAAVDFSTLTDKVMVGYQGWHWASGDASSYNKWHHWSRASGTRPGPTSCHFDIFPDMTEYTKKYNSDFYNPAGQRMQVYSSQDYSTVDTHFKWMRDYNVDGAFIQRFLNGFDASPTSMQTNIDKVLTHSKTAAEKYGRAFVVMYDVSGQNDSTLYADITRDWTQRIVARGFVSSPNYLRHNGKPLVAIWGMGKTDRPPANPNDAMSVINWFKSQGCTVMGGVDDGWRTLSRNSRTDPAWSNVYAAYDIISPWAVGTFNGISGADSAKENYINPDIAYVNSLNPPREYMPVAFPGFSWNNWNTGASNAFPRLGGDFLWRQAYNAKTAGAKMLYIAMFDEVDEGTAIYKCAPTLQQSPSTLNWVTMNSDGQNLPSDWYLRVTDKINQMFKGGIPVTTSLPLTLDNVPPIVTIAGAPPNNLARLPFTLTLTASSDFGYYSINGGSYVSIPANSPASVLISNTCTLRTYGMNVYGTSPEVVTDFVFDTTAPNISVVLGPATDYTSPQPFNVVLQVNDDWGYWSLNGAPYTQFGLKPVAVNTNYDFETGNLTSASGWVQNASHIRSQNTAHSGSWALRSVYRGAAGLASSTTFAVSPNKDYIFSAWIWKSDNNSNAYVDLNDIPGDIHLTVQNGVGGGQWTYKEQIWNSGSSTSATLRCVQDGGNITGDMIWDDVSLSLMGTTATTVISVTQTGTLSYYAQDAIGNNSGITTLNYIISDPYASWKSTVFTNPNAPFTARSSDYDGDGKSNEYEYYFGMNPSNANSSTGNQREPTAISINNSVGMTFTYRVDNPNLSYYIDTSYNLVNWSMDQRSSMFINAAPPVNNGDGTATVTIQYKNNYSVTPQVFIKVRVQEI